jgi:hypothetical protein
MDTLLIYENMPSVAQNLPDKESLPHDKGVDLQVCQCMYCGTIQLNNEPVPYYKEVIRATALSAEMKEFRTGQFAEFVAQFSLQDKKIIEIGCGMGENLPIMAKCGAKAYGLEYAEKSVQAAKGAGLNVYQGFLESDDYRIDSFAFDGFFTLNYLEHLPDPAAVLRSVCNNLSDVAYGIVEVPNMDMFVSEGLFYDFMQDHLFYFTKDTLKNLLQLSGFEVLGCTNIWHDYIISATVKKKTLVDLAHFEKNRLSLISQIDGYIGSFGHHKTAVWGAGHQALFILSMLRNAKQLKYVVDSADFKQGKYTPVSHLPIVPPDRIHSDPVEAIIVMAGSFSGEVAQIIQKLNPGIRISILGNKGLESVDI